MARTISAAGLAKLAENYGTEPITIIEVYWTDGGTPISYADRDIPAGSILGRILEIGNLDNVVNVSKNNQSQEISVVLDDTDGTIKAIQDVNDVHQREVRVYQWFEGLALTDKFELFRGRINSPFTWSERDRTFSFSVVSQLEDKEIGFSPEEGQFSSIRDDLIGQPWPMCFGTTVNNKGLQLSEVKRGTLADPIGISDFTLGSHMGAHSVIKNFLTELATYWAFAGGYLKFIGLEDEGKEAEANAAALFAQANERQEQINQLNATLSAQKAKERSSVRIVGGRDFPQGTSLVLDINGGQFTGHFIGDTFYIAQAIHPEAPNYGTPPAGTFVPGTSKNLGATIGGGGGGAGTSVFGGAAGTAVELKRFFRAEGFNIKQVNGSGGFIPNGTITGDAAGEFLAQPGASVSIKSAEPMQYVASITPGTVLRVSAWRRFKSGARHLVDVGNWSASVVTYGAVSATIVTVNDALSKTEGFDDTVYITFQSTIGPNTVDILEHLISTYTSFTKDTTTFAAVKTKLANYPSHFCITDRKNILTALQEIAFQARCAIWLSNGNVYLRYLPEAPTSVETITESDIDAEQSIEMSYTPSEDLVTKLVAVWREHGAQDDDNKIILRHNIKKYGTHEQEFDWYIYNNRHLVIKSATFWLIRMANTWKKMKFATALNKLKLETFDGVTLDFNTTYVANVDVLGVVEKADYDSESNTLQFEVWTPVRVGEMTPFDFAYPHAVSSTLKFPTSSDVGAGYAGGDGPGKGASGGAIGAKKAGNLSVTYNGSSDPFGFGARQYGDQGDPTPSDSGDSNPGSPTTGAANPDVGGNATPSPTPPASSQPPKDRAPIKYIDLHETRIVDGKKPGNYATLSTFFDSINGDKKLVMKTKALISDGSEDKEKEFGFKFDDDEKKWGAEIAFLKDN